MPGLTPYFSVIIPTYRSARQLRKTLASLARSVFSDYECLVVIDGPLDESAAIAADFGAQVLTTGVRKGPACARNLGARSAVGDVLVFLDSDVCAAPDTLAKIHASFERDRTLNAVFGSYDDSPPGTGFFSRYRNLMHCYVHRTGRREASTFWAGCGAIQRKVFLGAGGFNEAYRQPSIEDIELGYRLSAAGRSLALDPDISVTHLKERTFWNMVRTDILQRGIPWTELILRSGKMPNDLNLKLSQRVSIVLVYCMIAMAAGALVDSPRPFLLTLAVLCCLMLGQVRVIPNRRYTGQLAITLCFGLCLLVPLSYQLLPWVPWVTALSCLVPELGERRRKLLPFTDAISTACSAVSSLALLTVLPGHPFIIGFYGFAAAVILINSGFYRFLASRLGWARAVASMPCHMLFHAYSGFSFAVGCLIHLFRSRP